VNEYGVLVKKTDELGGKRVPVTLCPS